ncbi:MAG: Flp pilus assembly complex ATPase component TadA [Phycisphaerae bacterium]|nr:Flp pilus assembly complex ATPase component TadA [Phycisphaerae bacterium]
MHMNHLATLAAVDTTIYVNPIKIAIVMILVVLWGMAVQWVDRDTDVVKTRREHWNLIVISGGFVGFIVLLVPPWRGWLFLGGLFSWLLIAGGALMAYVIHRNGRVVPAARVLTAAHVKRLMGGERKKAAASTKGMRIQISDSSGKFVGMPEDAETGAVFDKVQDLLYEVLWRRASMVDLIPGKEKYRLVYKVDGVVSEKPDGIPSGDAEQIIRYLKQIAGLNAEEIRRPQSGTIEAALLSHEGDVGKTEVKTSGTTVGERMQLRVQSHEKLLRLHELGLAAARLESIRKDILAKPTGLFIVAAPPEHGMTMTQYAVLRSHDAYMHNIHTLERRPLLELDNITQQRFDGANTDVNYARMLQTILRREPDIILVGECEDRETAMLAARAAAEDRKVYMGLSAKDTGDALEKLIKFVENPGLVAKALKGVIAERLVRTLCTECREAFQPDEATLKKLNLPAEKIERFYRPPTEPKVDRKGVEIVCQNCQGTGYRGRTGIFELMIVDDAVAGLIAQGAPINKIKAQCRKNKMYYLQEEGLLKVIDGTTSMNEILRVLRSADK